MYNTMIADHTCQFPRHFFLDVQSHTAIVTYVVKKKHLLLLVQHVWPVQGPVTHFLTRTEI